MKTIKNLDCYIDERTCEFIAPHITITYAGVFNDPDKLSKAITERLEQAQNDGQLDLETEAGSDTLRRIVDYTILEHLRS